MGGEIENLHASISVKDYVKTRQNEDDHEKQTLCLSTQQFPIGTFPMRIVLDDVRQLESSLPHPLIHDVRVLGIAGLCSDLGE